MEVLYEAIIRIPVKQPSIQWKIRLGFQPWWPGWFLARLSGPQKAWRTLGGHRPRGCCHGTVRGTGAIRGEGEGYGISHRGFAQRFLPKYSK